jgi:hypothetical protein
MRKDILFLHLVHYLRNSALFRQLKEQSAVVEETRKLTKAKKKVQVLVLTRRNGGSTKATITLKIREKTGSVLWNMFRVVS